MIGTIVDETYKLLDELDRDDRGVTYLARLVTTSEVVDITFLDLPGARDDETIKRIQREVAVLGALRDAHIVRLYKHGEWRGQHYLVFQHVPGISLRAVIGQMCQHQQSGCRCLNEEQTLRIIKQVARGLQYAHTSNVLHRGLRPEAIILDSTGVVRIGDFRFAKNLGSVDITIDGFGVGGAVYSAPEQLEGKAEKASDVYGLGVLMYEMLTGRPPQSAKLDPLQRQMLGNRLTIEPPHVALPALTSTVDAFIMRCLAHDLAARPADASDFAEALAEYLPQTEKTDSGPFASGGDTVIAGLVERVSQWRGSTAASPGAGASTQRISAAKASDSDRKQQEGFVARDKPQTLPPLPRTRAWVATSDGRRIDLDATIKTEFRVGRLSAQRGIIPDVPFDEGWIHRRYLKIEYRRGSWVLMVEAGVEHGVALNERKLESGDEEILADGDVVVLGQQDVRTVSFVFHCQ